MKNLRFYIGALALCVAFASCSSEAAKNDSAAKTDSKAKTEKAEKAETDPIKVLEADIEAGNWDKVITAYEKSVNEFTELGGDCLDDKEIDKSKLRDLEKVTAKIMKTIQKKAVDTNKMPEDKVKEYLDCNFDFNIMYGKLSNAGKL